MSLYTTGGNLRSTEVPRELGGGNYALCDSEGLTSESNLSQQMGSSTAQVCKSSVLLFGNLRVLIIHLNDFSKSTYSQNREVEVSLYRWAIIPSPVIFP